ncbi:hypothetical protein bwei_5318 [Bacillus mycoides]|uniref:hypothetical protein n=1 Tax=Bacillus mycoides TaxID=1405 RepID=UPI0001A056CC|nr:hypothetical protein [Bacillus mycoides]AIW87861.1 hypothetical protein bwei_5318 [Bacillus mycoides]EEL02855.1 hypothetical protein bcere0014_56120 [Bacillus cereus BDRD-ST196]MED1406175.1 hypothetical protein [Bacillus mycoides]GAE42706.1 hypothetical protein BW1_072_00130 [Bacillus mycoides NBRC 101238 = DSM 11821]
MLETLEFKSTLHGELFAKMMDKMNAQMSDRYRVSLAWVWSAIYKEELLDCVDSGVSLDKVDELIKPYTNAEKSLVRFGLQCYNENFDDITLPDVLVSLDLENKEVVRQTIYLRYDI